MRVTIRLFARLKDLAAAGELVCEVPTGSSVAAVWRALVHEYPGLVPYGSSVSAAINAEYAKMDAAVAEGDEVAFLPPVSGGSESRAGIRTREGCAVL
jgi:molybdopterin converting factor subunit 1